MEFTLSLIDQFDEHQLTAFIHHHLNAEEFKQGVLSLSPIQGDAGARRYFRLNTQTPMMAVWAPLASEDSAQFCRIAHSFLSLGVRVPRIVATDFVQGFLLLEDLGQQDLQSDLSMDTVDGYYAEAMSMLLHLQSASSSTNVLEHYPHYSAALLGDEMHLCDEWYFDAFLGLSLSEDEQQLFNRVKAQLVEAAIAQPQVIVHRDFHSRNLMVLKDGSLATIDFQDAVVGPITYDLVSLLKDCYIEWPQERIQNWAITYASMLHETELIDDAVHGSFMRTFEWMGMQRHIKVLGVL